MQGYKTDFPLLMQDKTVYIDNAATAQRPKCVIDAEKDFYTCHNANPLRGIYELSVQATEDYENARKAVRDFIGAKSVQEIIFTRNTTESINLVAYSYGLSNLKKGDEVILINIGQKGILLSDPDKSGNVTVQAGIIKTKTNTKNLMLIDGVKVTFTDKNGRKMPVKSAGDKAVAAFSPELDLRGNYADDACFLLDKYLDDARRAGVTQVRIIHGKGTGALRRAVTDFLRRDARVASVRCGTWGEGDTGVAVAELK